MTSSPGEDTVSNIEALRLEANRQLDEAIASGNAHVWDKGARYDGEGVMISRITPNFFTVSVEFDEPHPVTKKILDLTVEVEYLYFENNQTVRIFEDRVDPETQEGGRKNIPDRKHEDAAGRLLKILAQVV